MCEGQLGFAASDQYNELYSTVKGVDEFENLITSGMATHLLQRSVDLTQDRVRK